MKRRFSLNELLALVAVAALGLGAMRDGSELALGATVGITIVALLVALLGAIVRTQPRGAWAGFAVFGWATFLLSFVPYFENLSNDVRISRTVQWAADILQPEPAKPSNLAYPFLFQNPSYVENYKPAQGSPDAQFKERYLDWNRRHANDFKIAKAILCLILALAGSVLGRFLARRSEAEGRDSSQVAQVAAARGATGPTTPLEARVE